jgi:mannose-6-phosphate isomerase
MKTGAREAGATSPPAPVRSAAARLKRWLFDHALPIWWELGADRAQGGFHDTLDPAGRPVTGPKRLRVQARQAHVYALAARLGWDGPAVDACRHGLDHLLAHRDDDGLYRPSPARPEAPFDGMGLLYDQAFALLGLAAGLELTGEADLEVAAIELQRALRGFAHPLGGYREAPGLAAPLFANPNMHLFESFQAWAALSADPCWRELAALQAHLGVEFLMAGGTSPLIERYGPDWSEPEAARDRVIWPGHLYEWAWLLLEWGPEVPRCAEPALALIDVAEETGVDGAGFTIFALDGDLKPLDGGARLWAQTERLRACARAASLGLAPDLWDATVGAASALEAFLEVPQSGLWRDWRDETGAFREEPAPASSLYHIAGAIAELERVCAG